MRKALCAALASILLLTCPALGAETGGRVESLGVSGRVVRLGGFDVVQTDSTRAQLLTAQSEKEQAVYDRFYQFLREGWNLDGSETPGKDPACYIDFTDLHLSIENDLDMAFGVVLPRVLNDHPELFYINGDGSYYGSKSDPNELGLVQLLYDKRYTADDVALFQETTAAVTAALELKSTALSPEEKLLAIHDYLVETVTYNALVAGGQAAAAPYYIYNAFGALVMGDAVCQGYSEAFLLLCNEAGIPCTLLPSEPMNHAWNVVQVGEQWYHIDATWDDQDQAGFVDHDFFLRSTAWMEKGPDGKIDHDTDPNSDDHYGWGVEPMGPGDETYAEGWAFNGQTRPLHRTEDGTYYYVSGADLMKGPLEGAGSKTATLQPNYTTSSSGSGRDYTDYTGVVWVGDYLCYLRGVTTSADHGQNVARYELRRLDPAGGQDLLIRSLSAAWGALPLELSHNAGLAELNVWLEGEEILRAPLFSEAWQSDSRTHVAETASFGVLLEDGSLASLPYARIYWAEETAQEAAMVCAWYQDGRMVYATAGTFQDLTPGCYDLEMSGAALPPSVSGAAGEYQLKVFLLTADGALVPLTGKWEGPWTAA